MENNPSILGKLYIWLHSHINHIIFKNNYKLSKLKEATEKGEFNVQSRLEKMLIEKERTKLIIDKINIQKNSETVFETEVGPKKKSTLEKLESKFQNVEKEILSFVKCKHILKHYWMCIYRILFSSTQFYVYIAMILGHLFNGSILTLPYPISVFLYAMIEHCRPKKQYWTIMLLYTEFVLAVKFIIQLQLITSWIISQETFNDNLVNEYRIGLKIYDSVTSSDFFMHIFFECLIIFAILVHQYVLVFLGIYDKREIEQEDIIVALDRISDIKIDIPDEQSLSEEESSDHNSEDSLLSEEEGLNINSEHKFNPPNVDETSEKKDQKEISPSTISHTEKMYSGPPKISKNCFSNLLSYLCFRNSYCESIFPTLKIEKPGYDYNNKIIYLQLFIAVYLIIFYATMTADYEDISVALSFKQFSGEMIIVLLFHIGVIIFERYMYLKDFSGSGVKPRRFDVIMQNQGIQRNTPTEGQDSEPSIDVDKEELNKWIYQSFKTDYSETYNSGKCYLFKNGCKKLININYYLLIVINYYLLLIINYYLLFINNY